MLAAVPRHTKKIDIGLGCFDHLLNLVMQACNKQKADEPIAKAIKVIFVILRNNRSFNRYFRYYRNYRKYFR